ncbi:MAG TPA: hypothetical protein VNQ77_06435 [Frankiaceae bacterium]|nr:hypothetical protein [Frankiaceae bacterium]
MRLAPVRTIVAVALLGATAAPAAASDRVASAGVLPAAVALTSTPVADSAATARLHAAADRVRSAHGQQALFGRSAYAGHAKLIATATMNGLAPSAPGDDAPIAYLAGTATDGTYAASVDAAITAIVNAATAVLAYPLHTDGGWYVVTKRLTDGRIRYGAALVVGWPSPNVSRTSGCASGGYCWSNGGLNPHLPWTRNTVKWYLSTSGLPSAGESLVKAAIAKVNAVSRFGAHVVYGGRTTATGPTSTRRFVVVFGSGCSESTALGCTITSTQGTYKMVFQAKTIITMSRYRANPSTTWWTGTLMHEIGHAMGLGHFESTYGGTYQLMRSAHGPDYIKSGDMNGLRDVAPAGRLSASVTAKPRSTGGYTLVVRTANSGLGGVRAVRTQCTDANGAWQTTGLVSGTYDTRATNRTVGAFTPPRGATRSCRAIVRSKTAVMTTASITVRG